jgi:soluble cytochrome b562
MKNRLLLLTAAFALAIGPAVIAQDAKQKEPQSELGAKMDKISSDWRAVKRQLPDSSKNADTLAKLTSMKQAMADSAKLEPALKSEIPAGEQSKFMADYQERMKQEIAKVDQIAALVKDGKNEEAAKLTGALDQAQKDAHKQFKKQKKKQ